MTRYRVTMIGTIVRAVEVEADSPDEAAERALDAPESEWIDVAGDLEIDSIDEL